MVIIACLQYGNSIIQENKLAVNFVLTVEMLNRLLILIKNKRSNKINAFRIKLLPIFMLKKNFQKFLCLILIGSVIKLHIWRISIFQ